VSRSSSPSTLEPVVDARLIEPVFQPIVALESGEAVGWEALSRFRAVPIRPPQRWFADAERAGLRTELELAAARKAIAEFRTANLSGYLALNISPGTLRHAEALRLELGGHPLVLELTEHTAIDDYDQLAPCLARLRAAGALIAVDDAGAGFASLRHVLQLSPDIIKLDMALIRDIDRDRRRRALARGLIGFAGELGTAIVAEGIEQRGELETLQHLGAGYGQGYFLARPRPLPVRTPSIVGSKKCA
jgi:EAL domain-containing protein (putative c-di-GMP-specific phosphodiesterase class I)